MYPFDPKFQSKVDELRQGGVEPYPTAADFPVSHLSTALHDRYNRQADPEPDPESRGVAVAGRLMFRNRMGKLLFLRIQDRGEPSVRALDADGDPLFDDDGAPVWRGGVLQIMVQRDLVGVESFERLKKLDIGDFVWAVGDVVRTRTGELTLRATQARLASKIVAPFPDRFHQLTDPDTRYRQRYVDLFLSPEVRATFRTRSRVVSIIRRFFEDRDFIEVETPMMQTIPGGATARPFVTHHNALDIELYLRVAPELYLKRLVVGGFERVFEVNRNFRNEGISLRHNPEFTMLEFYQAWATYHDLMDLTQELLSTLVAQVLGSDPVVQVGPHRIDFSPPYRRVGMGELIAEHAGIETADLRDPQALAARWRELHPDHDPSGEPTTWAGWWVWFFDALVEPKLVDPTFVTGFPAEISPLARRSDGDPELTDRFELFIGTWEIANAFTELNDPVDQAGRFAAQVQAREGGDDEAMYFDRDYVRALTYGMPPTAGQGIGIDRLVMLLTGNPSIREVILFPTLRPERWNLADPEQAPE